MIRTTRLAALLLSTALLGAPCLMGTAYAHGHEGEGKAGYMPGEHQHFSPAQIKLLHETMHRLHESDHKTYEEMHKLHHEMHAVLTAPVFDKQAYLSLTGQIDAQRDLLRKNRNEAFASIAGQFSPEQRKHLARLFAHRHHKGWHHGGWHHGEGHHGWGHHHQGWQQHEQHGGWERHDGRDGHEEPDGWNHHESQPDGAMQDGVTNGDQPTIQQNTPSGDYPPYKH